MWKGPHVGPPSALLASPARPLLLHTHQVTGSLQPLGFFTYFETSVTAL